MNQHNNKSVGELTSLINSELQTHSELLSTNCTEILAADEIIKIYFNTVFPQNYKQSVYVMCNKVVVVGQIIPFCEEMVIKANFQKLIHTNPYSTCKPIEKTVNLLLIGVVSELLNKNKEYFEGLNRFDLIEDMQKLCLTLMLHSLETLTEQVSLLKVS
ncbi:hypothetical protein CO725_00800 [Vibrio parahaemolyticus]|uniref:hypothetical protein n=1 Tax=Vibrio parahaemolyticus TaxID=670 RepID=UPI000BE32E97|nr:hypothetical protein [Vibrio parahaemolyticus]ATI44224.1 hypothetical protein CO725_00800 [Vibrio parahaemolyticus]